MNTEMIEAIKDCIVNERPVTLINTYTSDTIRLDYYMKNLKQSIYNAIGLHRSLLGKND